MKIASTEHREEVFEEENIQIKLQFGEFSPFLERVNHYLAEAKKYAANEVQVKMIEEYINHFNNGNV